MTLPRPCSGKCNDSSDLSPEVRSHLSEEAQRTFIERYNAVYDEAEDPMKADRLLGMPFTSSTMKMKMVFGQSAK